MRQSPVFDSLSLSLPAATEWQTVNTMPTAWITPNDADYAQRVGLCDRSFLNRFGVKGAGAADWLSSFGIPIPSQLNQWCDRPDGVLIARLGVTEFLIEDSIDSALTAQLKQQMANLPPKIYPVLRQDVALSLIGSSVPDLLRQTCNVNFQALNLSDRPVILTSMIGVSVVVIPGEKEGVPFYRVWGDGTFGVYMWETLAAIAEEMGGGAIGAACG
jgi:sarcosine oxidase subunit gamma